jgi:hypothetical protein
MRRQPPDFAFSELALAHCVEAGLADPPRELDLVAGDRDAEENVEGHHARFGIRQRRQSDLEESAVLSPDGAELAHDLEVGRLHEASSRAGDARPLFEEAGLRTDIEPVAPTPMRAPLELAVDEAHVDAHEVVEVIADVLLDRALR